MGWPYFFSIAGKWADLSPLVSGMPGSLIAYELGTPHGIPGFFVGVWKDCGTDLNRKETHVATAQ